MQRQTSVFLAAAVVLGSLGAFAQSGGLAGVTLRVLDDVSGLDAVILAIDAQPGPGEEASDASSNGRDEPAANEAPQRDGAAEREPDTSSPNRP